PPNVSVTRTTQLRRIIHNAAPLVSILWTLKTVPRNTACLLHVPCESCMPRRAPNVARQANNDRRLPGSALPLRCTHAQNRRAGGLSSSEEDRTAIVPREAGSSERRDVP
ncbi:unnamed protein product, partial [Ectocarpus sp. 12 AP-2014]